MIFIAALGLFAHVWADAGRTYHVSYNHAAWNTDSKKLDSGYIILRDPGSGQTQREALSESAPDSGVFEGVVSVTYMNKPEVYVLAGTDAASRARKPFVVTLGAGQTNTIEIFDTREETIAALKARRVALRNQSKVAASRQDLAAASQRDKAQQAEAIAARQALRADLETEALKRREQHLGEVTSLNEDARRSRLSQASTLALEGDELYSEGDYIGAEPKFRSAADLDPDHADYYYKYGVSLYRNQRYNEALVVLDTAHVDAGVEPERQFYTGLAHERLGELEAAQKSFVPLADGTDPVLGPSSRFYLGEIAFNLEQFDEAKRRFDDVVKNAADPAMRDSAAVYLHRIATTEADIKARSHRWNVMGVLGLMYDSNVLLAPDNARDQGLPTDVSDARILTIGQVDYRPVYTEHHEWGFSLNENITNSGKTISAEADPYITNVSLPYSYKTSGYRLTARPAYEFLYMDPDGTGTKSLILQSALLTFDNTFVFTPSWFSTYTIEYRRDLSDLPSSVGQNDEDAHRWALRTNQAWFLDAGRREAVIANLGYVLNNAVGTNERYTRWEIGAGYIRPTIWGMSWNFGVNYFSLKYGSADPTRHDSNTMFTLGVSKPVRDWVTLGLVGTQTRNSSNQSIYSYSKYVIMTTATFTGAF